MRNFLRFIIQHHFTFLFIILELIAFILVVNYNQDQRNIYLSSSSKIAGGLFQSMSNVEQYFSLREVNRELSNENAFLRSQMPSSFKNAKDYFLMSGDSATAHQYKYRSCKVISNTVGKHFNYITLNKGTLDGIKPDMGVLSGRGVVGIVINCSDNFCTVLSILNPRLKISAKLKESDFFGSVSWDTESILYAILDEIPEHANVNLGDQVITSGFSATFPEGILIGTVEEVTHPEGDSFYKIKVKLSVDFSRLSYVEVVENIYQEQQKQIEEDTKQ